jgi:membrane protease YdiL (CAAX protease family)
MHDTLPPVLLVLSLAALVWFQRRAVRNFGRFRGIETSAGRQRAYLRWAARSCARNLGVALLGLALLGRIDAPWRFPSEFVPLAWIVPHLPVEAPGYVAVLLLAAACALALGGWLSLRRPPRPRRGYDITPMLPRNRAELLHIAPMVLNAGISEEIYFRAYLPLLLMLCGVPDWAAFVIAALIFGLIHRYQGWLGVVLGTLAGAVFGYLYLGSGTLLLPIAVHLAANFNNLMLRPALRLLFRPTVD